jgi:hypothetical protein
MQPEKRQSRLNTAAIVVGYAMSRLDSRFLAAQRLRSWKAAFERAGKALRVPPSSLKNLRDEFDPFHENPRKGWHNRPLRPNRQRVLSDFFDVSDDALLECVERILTGDEPATAEIVESVRQVARPTYNVAERLLTGRLAEDFFLGSCDKIIGVGRSALIDQRFSALGFDFGVAGMPERAIEVKGLKLLQGNILFTDREWAEAKLRREDYWLVVVGNLASSPSARVWRSPHDCLTAACRYQRTLSATWTARVSLTSDAAN